METPKQLLPHLVKRQKTPAESLEFYAFRRLGTQGFRNSGRI